MATLQMKKLSDCDTSTCTSLLYCPPGVGKSTAIGLIAENSEGNTLVIDVDRTITRTLAKGEIVKDTSKIFVSELENRAESKDGTRPGTFKAWCNLFRDLSPEFLKSCEITTIAVDNISELERCILSDFGQQGKNKGVPAQADYQYMQFALVNSLRQMKALGVNVIWTAWEEREQFVDPSGATFTVQMPKISKKIRDNICGLCDVVGRIYVNKDGEHGIQLCATQNVYGKNQMDARKACKVEDFTKWKRNKDENEKEKK
jgi:phage nucleotide-binding protein